MSDLPDGVMSPDAVLERLVELRIAIGQIEERTEDQSMGALNAGVDELMALHAELCEVYLEEMAVYGGHREITAAQDDVLNAMEETLEAAQETTLEIIGQIRSLYPEEPDRPEIIAFEETVEQMRDEVGEYEHRLYPEG